ncbi:condensation domain-containing protein [Vibrio sp. PP-XX7]
MMNMLILLVVIRVHHIIADFNFVENILKDLFDNHQIAHYLSQDHALSELESIYLSSDEYHRDISFWKNELHERKTIIEFPSEKNQSSYFNGGLCRTKINDETYRLLQRYCQMERISPARVLYSIFAATLYRLSGQDEFCMGLSVDLRKYYPEHSVIHVSVNVLPVVNHFCSHDPSVMLSILKILK